MEKTKNPTDYLMKAEKLLDIMKSVNVWSKLNILLYPGETNDTILETITWLDKHKQKIKGVSVNPFILYLTGNNTESFIKKIENLTGIMPDINKLYYQGFVFNDLSNEISINRAKEISKLISDRYMTFDYQDLKNVCYIKNL